MLVLLVPIGGMAEVKQFGVFDAATGTLTFRYEELDYGKFAGYGIREGWKTNVVGLKKVVFSPECINVKVESLSNFFSHSKELTEIEGIEYLNTSEVTDMRWMFYDCESLTSLDLSSFNTSNVTDMNSMFKGCSSLTSLNLSNFNTSKVTDMTQMFYRCSSLTSLDVSKFDTSNVTDMVGVFSFCS